MANNFDSNFTREVMMKILPAFETKRILSKNVNTQLFDGKFNPNTGSEIDVKRPTDYLSVRSSDGDIGSTKRDIITGKATATVQDYITVPIDFGEAKQSLEMGTDITRFWDDAAQRIVTDLEVDFASYMVANAGLLSGTYGTAVTTWSDVANAGALMAETGVPAGPWHYAMNSFTQAALADKQTQLGAVDSLVKSAFEQATLKKQYAGFENVMASTALARVTNNAATDKVGALSASPNVTYVAAKDTMTQVLAVNAFEADLVVKAGQVVTIAGRYRLNASTKQLVVDAAGANVLWSAVVVADVTLSGTGTGNLVVAGPAIFEAAGAYNTVDSAPVITDVVTLLGATTAQVYQPNMFWHRDAFTIATVKMQKLFATDTIATTKDGIQLRVSRYSDGDANKQTVRLDLRPAYGVMNPLMAGQGWG